MFGNPQDDELLPNTYDSSTQSTSSPSRVSMATNLPLSIRANMHINLTDDSDDGKDDMQMQPLLETGPSTAVAAASLVPGCSVQVRARKSRTRQRRRRNRNNLNGSNHDGDKDTLSPVHWLLVWLCRSESGRAQWAASCFRFLWRLFLWTFIVIIVVGVFWYSYELHKNE